MRQCFVLNDDFSDLVRHAFAGAQVKGHARPSPVIDVRFDRNERLGITALCLTALFVEITGHGFTVDDSLTILATNDVILHARCVNRSQCFDDLDLLVTNALCLK